MIRELEGNPGKRPLNDREPTPPPGVPDCPEYLDDDARAEWFRTAGVLNEMGLLSRADRSALAAYGVLWLAMPKTGEQIEEFR